MTSRQTRLRSEKYEKNIDKRGNVPVGTAAKRENKYPVNPVVLGLFLFVVLGSAVFQVIQTVRSGPAF